MKHHLVYKTTQISTGRIYIGKHSTNKLEDGYKGSGTEIAPLLKETPDDFVREILFDFPNSIEAFRKEAELVTPEFLEGKGTTVFNKVPGGNLSQTSIKAWSVWQPGEPHPPITYSSYYTRPSVIIEITRRSCTTNKTQHTMHIPGYKEYYGAAHMEDLIDILKNKNQAAYKHVSRVYSQVQGTYFFVAIQNKGKQNKYIFVALNDFQSAEVYWKDSGQKINACFLMAKISSTKFIINTDGPRNLASPYIPPFDIEKEFREQKYTIAELKSHIKFFLSVINRQTESAQRVIDAQHKFREKIKSLQLENEELKKLLSQKK